VRAYLDATRAVLVYYRLPVVGPIAESWLAEE